MTTLEHYQLDLVNDQPVMAWVVWETFEDEGLAEKELIKLQRRFTPAEFRLTHTPD
tara:strand:- start:600 stop:767 length:168 start_codon:yes stop_codon:yes gene_type:complete